MSTHRASLLTGLRTGGPRSVTNGAYNAPQTASIGGQFPTSHVQFPSGFGYEQEFSHYANDAIGMPMTAPAKDATFPQLQQQQTQFMLLQAQAQAQAQAVQNAVMSNQGGLQYGFQSGMTPEQQAFNLQFEVYKMQALHQQQLQSQILQEAQRQMLFQQQQQSNLPSRRRPSEPVTASPYVTTFGTPAKPRAVSVMNEGALTASLDGRFPPSKLNPHATSFQLGGNDEVPPTPTNAAVSTNWRAAERVQPQVPVNTPATPNFSGVLSGGAPLGVVAPSAGASAATPAAKHSLASSWRRPSVAKTSDSSASRTPSPSGSPSASPPPTVYVSTPEETSPVQSRSTSPPVHRAKPQPLRFAIPGTIAEQQDTDSYGGQTLSMGRNMSDIPSSPLSPTSGSPTQSLAREEAARRLYEGLGIGRPTPQGTGVEPARNVSQPARQPHGPPSGVEDLGPRNFAARIRRKAIGGLGVLMDARGRRSSMIEIEAY